MTTVLVYPFDASDTTAPATFWNVAGSDTIGPSDKISTYVVGTRLFVFRVKST